MMMVSTWASSGARNRMSVISAQATRTRAPRLFSAMSLATRSAADPLRRGPAGAAVEVKHGAVDGRVEAEEGGQAEVGAGHVGAGVGADDEVGDVGGRPPPLGDGLARGRGGKLWHGGGRDVHPGV
jgi:hypothetical protein